MGTDKRLRIFDFDALMRDPRLARSLCWRNRGVVYNAGNVVPQTRVKAQHWGSEHPVWNSGFTYQVSSTLWRIRALRQKFHPEFTTCLKPGGPANRRDIVINVVAVQIEPECDLYCGVPVIDSDGPIVSRCNITASSALVLISITLRTIPTLDWRALLPGAEFNIVVVLEGNASSRVSGIVRKVIDIKTVCDEAVILHRLTIGPSESMTGYSANKDRPPVPI